VPMKRLFASWSVLMVLAGLAHSTWANAQSQPGKAEETSAAEVFGRELARAMNERNAKAFAGLLDVEALAERAAAEVTDDPKARKEFASGVVQGGVPKMIANQFMILEKSRGRAVFLRATHARPSRSLVRLDLNEQGFDYLEYLVVRGADGRYRAIDWFMLSTGELASSTMGGIGKLFIDPEVGFLERFLGAKVAPSKALVADLRRVGELQRAGKFAEAADVLRSMPDEIANSRYVLSLRARLEAIAGQHEKYTRSLAQLAARYSDDPSLAFVLLDHYFTRKETDKAVRSIELMEKRVGVDGVTSFLKANSYADTGRYAEALKFAQEAVRLEPQLADGHFAVVLAQVGLKDYAEAVKEYRLLEKDFGYTFSRDAFAADPQYAGFMQSAAFKAWLPK
jgi:tetratricopeptide (TPR) repeat protein